MRVLRVVLLLAFAAWGFSACTPPARGDFAIYLLAEDLPLAEWTRADLDALSLAKEPVISTADIVSYSWDSHEIELTAAAYDRVQGLYTLPVDVDGLPFVVCVGNDRVYAGAFWTPLSSLSFDGVTIMQPFSTDDRSIHIERGYPTSDFFRGSDPRSDARVLQAMTVAGRLK